MSSAGCQWSLHETRSVRSPSTCPGGGSSSSGSQTYLPLSQSCAPQVGPEMYGSKRSATYTNRTRPPRPLKGSTYVDCESKLVGWRVGLPSERHGPRSVLAEKTSAALARHPEARLRTTNRPSRKCAAVSHGHGGVSPVV
eukprot:4998269-Prymnesium_polylepis.1